MFPTPKTPARLALAILLALAVNARAADSDPVVASNSTAEVRLSELKSEIDARVPKDIRTEFVSNSKRVGELVSQLLLRRTLAQQAKAAKLDEKPANATRLKLDTERALSQFRVAAIEEKAAVEFDAKLPQYVARAREIYLGDRERFRTPAEVSASHILFDIRKHGSDEARKLAEQARARLVAGADFRTVAREVSEDPSVAQNGGELGWFTKDKMVAPFANAAFAMKTVGSISEPVQTSFGWHLIRLDGRKDGVVKPFDEVRDEIVAELRAKYVEEQRDAALNVVRDDPKTKFDETALDEFVATSRGRPLPALPGGAPAKP
jgi:peptidyl-prolyl cis-trans isomerase C